MSAQYVKEFDKNLGLFAVIEESTQRTVAVGMHERDADMIVAALAARSDAAPQEQALREALAALEQVQWDDDLDETCASTGNQHCIACNVSAHFGEAHESDCVVSNAIAALRAALNQDGGQS